MVLAGLLWQGHRKGGSLAGCADHGQRSAVHFNESFGQTQTQTQALTSELEMSRRVPGDIEAGEKGLKQERSERWVDAHSGIGYANLRGVLSIAPRGDLNLPPIGREFDGVQKKVIDAIANFPGVAVDATQIRRHIEAEFLPALLHKRPNVLSCLAHECAQVHRPALEWPV